MIGSIWDWIVVIAVVLILFGGASKIPELFRALGRAVGEFRKGQLEVEREINQLLTARTGNQQQAQAPTNQASGTGDNTGQVSDKDKEIEELRRQVEQLRMEIERLRRQGTDKQN